MKKELVLSINIIKEKHDTKDYYTYKIRQGDSAEDTIKALADFLDQKNIIAQIINELVIGKLSKKN